MLLAFLRFFSGMVVTALYVLATSMKGMKEPSPYAFLLTVSTVLCVWVIVSIVHDVLDLLGRPR